MTKPTKEVFISYKAEEFDDANWVRATLEHNGISCWMAPMCIPGGSNYAMEIPQAIRNCKVLVLLLSVKSQESKWIPREVDQAINEGKIVMPFMLEDCALKDDFSFYLSNVQRYNAYESKSAAMERMVREISAVLGRPLPLHEDAPAKQGPVSAQPSAPAPTEKQGEEAQSPAPQAPMEEPVAAQVPARGKETVSPARAGKDTAVAAEGEKEGKAEQTAPKKPTGALTPRHAGKVLAKMQKKSAALIAGAGFALALIVILVSVLWPRGYTIAGQRVPRDIASLTLAGTVTEEDVQTIAQLSELNSLSLKACTVTAQDLGALSTMGLYTLDLSDTSLTQQQIESLDFSAMTSLSALSLSGNDAFSDISVLSACAGSLRALDVSRTSVTTLEPLGAFEELVEICVSDCEIGSLVGLENCIRLESVYAANCALENLSGLDNTTLLREVDVCRNELSSLMELSDSAASLRDVRASDNSLEDLRFLRGATELRTLVMDRNRIYDLSPLSECTALRTLSCADNLIGNMDQISKLKDLQYLDLSGNSIVSADLANVVSVNANVDLSDNGLVFLSFSEDNQFSNLFLQGNSTLALQTSGVESIACFRLYLDFSAQYNMTQLSQAEVTYWHFVDCPADQKISLENIFGAYSISFDTAETVAELKAERMTLS